MTNGEARGGVETRHKYRHDFTALVGAALIRGSD